MKLLLKCICLSSPLNVNAVLSRQFILVTSVFNVASETEHEDYSETEHEDKVCVQDD